MYGDDEHPISFRFRADGGTPAHVVVSVWAGHDGSRGRCGDVTMRTDDWRALRELGVVDDDETNEAVVLDAVTLRERNRRVGVDRLVELVSLPAHMAVIDAGGAMLGGREAVDVAIGAVVQYLVETELVAPTFEYKVPDWLPATVGQDRTAATPQPPQ